MVNDVSSGNNVRLSRKGEIQIKINFRRRNKLIMRNRKTSEKNIK